MEVEEMERKKQIVKNNHKDWGCVCVGASWRWGYVMGEKTITEMHAKTINWDAAISFEPS